jgi:hypothetical protein
MLDWERNWRGAGVVFAVLIIIASVVYGSAPKSGAGADELVSFFNGDRTRILIAGVIFCFAFLELLWFGAALSSALRDAGQGGWVAAATASSAVLGAMLFLLMALRAGLAFSIADSGHPEFTTGLYQSSGHWRSSCRFRLRCSSCPEHSGCGGRTSSRAGSSRRAY